MTELMKRFNRQGHRVKIVIAQLGDVGVDPKAHADLMKHIWKWCNIHLGCRPEITDQKDGSMECLYDDKARQVIRNNGVDVGELAKKQATVLNDLLEGHSGNLKRELAMLPGVPPAPQRHFGRKS